MRGMLAEIGYADALLARRLPDGSLQLIDGHLRAELTPEAEVPVLVVDLDERETAKLLALHDPLAAMAQTDRELLSALAEQVETESQALASVLEGLVGPPSDEPVDRPPAAEPPVAESYQVVVQCSDEAQQQELYERLVAEGYRCRLLSL